MMNDLQRQYILKQLGRLMDLATSEDWDTLDKVRMAVKRWDLQGAIPYEAELRAWGIEFEVPAPLPKGDKNEEPSAPALPTLSEAEANEILQALQRLIIADGPDAEAQREARMALREWNDASRLAPLPYAAELAIWGVWPSTSTPQAAPPPPVEVAVDLLAQEPTIDQVTPESSTKPVADLSALESSPDSDAVLLNEYKVARGLVADRNLYQAIQRFKELQPLVQGNLSERLVADLNEASVELQRRTEVLLIAARRVQRERPRDLDAQAEAWRAVIALNPESQAANDALLRLQPRVREKLEKELKGIQEEARTAAGRDYLPDLNAARGRVETLAGREDLPEDLADSAQVLQAEIQTLLAETRARLGVASTKVVQGNLREAYRLARDYFMRKIPVIVDAEGILGPAGDDVSTTDFWRFISANFPEATRKKVDERLSSARAVRSSAPDASLETLQEAKGWLTDEVWTLDHRRELSPQLDDVEREIEDVQRLLKRYEEARKMVTEARNFGVPARTRLQLLNEAQQLYPDYPDIQVYLDEARDTLAGVLAAEVEGQIADAQGLTLQERFEEARTLLQRARADVARDIPTAKVGSSLEQALERVRAEEKAIVEAEAALRALEALLKKVDSLLAAYDSDKNPQRLNEANKLLDQIPEAQRQHLKTQEVRSRLAARQGEAENYSAGEKAYASRDWVGAIAFFEKITPAFSQHAAAQKYAKRARAVQAAEKARTAEAEGQGKVALDNYAQAVYLFEVAGDDPLTKEIAAESREAKKNIDYRDQTFKQPLKDAQDGLMRARSQVQRADAPLNNRLDRIAEFGRIITVLEPLADETSALVEDIKTILRDARHEWREAYLPVLRMVTTNADLTETLLKKALQRAGELKTAGLLTEPDEEQLYHQLRARLLDQEYVRLHIGVGEPDWKAIEQNRRERLGLPLAEKPREYHDQWVEARRKCLEAEIRTLREQRGALAAKDFLGEQLRSGKLRQDPLWVRQWLQLCWEASDWAEAERVAQWLADIPQTAQERRTQAALWLGLTRAARAYAEDDIDGARKHIEAIQLSDDVLDEVVDVLESQTLDRLLEKAAQGRRTLDKPGSANKPEQYFAVARAYGLALQLQPAHPVAQQALEAISDYIEPLLSQRCEEAVNLSILRNNLPATCAEAARLLADLRALQSIVVYLKLPNDASATLEEALETLQRKRELWDRASTQMKLFQEKVKNALALPYAFRVGDSGSGGWDFSDARKTLTELRAQANKASDKGLRDLLDAELRQLDNYDATAQKVTECARALLNAVAEEKFEAVMTAAEALETVWKGVQGEASAWDGLEILVRHLYQHPTSVEVRTPRAHRDHAAKQQNNVAAWEAYEKDISKRYAELRQAESELLDNDFTMLKSELALRDIIEKCMSWERQCDDVLKRLERVPPELPLSARAEAARAKAAREACKLHLNGDEGARARIAALKIEAQKATEEFTPIFNRFRNFYNTLPARVRNSKGSPSADHIRTAQLSYQECRKIDPRNSELQRLRKQLEGLKFTF